MRGQTPLRHESFGWKSLSLIGGRSLRRCHFQIHKGRLQSEPVVECIRHLPRPLQRRRLLLWDGAAIHRRKRVPDDLASTKGRVRAERLPPYAPELNPVEYLWAHRKSHAIANLITSRAWELSFEATAALRKRRRRPSILAACFSQAELWP